MNEKKDYLKAILQNKTDFKKEDKDNLNVLYVIDTNFLLYSLQTTNREHYYIEALEKNIDNLYIPFSVYMEFLDNFQDLIKRTTGFFESGNLILDKVGTFDGIEFNTSWMKNFLSENVDSEVDEKEKNSIFFTKDVYPKVDTFIEKISRSLSEKLDSLNNEFKECIENSKIDRSDFNVAEYENKVAEHLHKINRIFNYENVLGIEYTQETIDCWEQKIESRFSQQIPPGYKDKNKDNKNPSLKYRRFGNLKIKKSHGDAILWFDTMDFVKKNNYDKVVLVSDDSKGDWVDSGRTSDLLPELCIEFLQNTNTYIEKISTDKFISNFTNISSNEQKKLKRDIENIENIAMEETFRDYNKENTIVVPAKSDGFNKVFIGEKKWYSIRISDERKPFLKYIAAYRSSPYKKITHIATIKNIEVSNEDPSKKCVIFDGEAKELKNPIPLGENKSALQSIRYTSYEKLLESQDIDELFND